MAEGSKIAERIYYFSIIYIRQKFNNDLSNGIFGDHGNFSMISTPKGGKIFYNFIEVICNLFILEH